MAYVRTAFPDLIGDVEEILVEDNTVAARVTWRGTHGDVFLDVPATGVAVAFRAFHIVRFRAGRAVEWWGTADLLGALTQLGARVTPPA
jgi:predicted ester cyclase